MSGKSGTWSDHECPAGCGRMVRASVLMCPADWRRVPAALAREVYRTWRTIERGGASVEAWATYKRARQAAIDSVKR